MSTQTWPSAATTAVASPGVTAVYARISRDRDLTQAGTDRQVEDGLALAEAAGYPSPTVYRDEDSSAYKGNSGDRWADLLTDIAEGRVTHLVAWHTDRLTRSARESLAFYELCKAHGVRLHTKQGGVLDLDSAESRLMLGQLALIAEYESSHKGDRLRRMHEAKAKAGSWHGGRRPFGYTPVAGVLQINTQEALVVTEAARRLLAGESLHSVCRDLTARGVTGSAGGDFTPTRLRKLLLTPTLAGLRTHRGEVVGEGAWEPILDSEVWADLGTLLRDPARRVTKTTVRVHPFTGVGRCGVCEGPLRAKTTARGATVYVCKSGSHVHRSTELVNDRILGLVAERLLLTDARGVFSADNVSDTLTLQDAAAQQERKLARYLADYDAGDLDGKGYKKLRERAEAELGRITHELGVLELNAKAPARILEGYAGNPNARALLDAAGPDKQRAVVAALGTPYLDPAAHKGAVWDPKAVRMVWHS
jgi:site-specific DNA recombinase